MAGDPEHAAVNPAARAMGLQPEEFSAAVSAVTAAFGDPTRRDIYLLVRAAAQGMTAAEIAEQFELHPNVARHHLEKLTAGGYLTVELARHESAGRPSKRYRASELDTTLNFPPRRDNLLATLLARALELLDPDDAAAMADQVGYEYGLALAANMTPLGPPGSPSRAPAPAAAVGKAATAAADPTAGAANQRSVRAAVATVADALTAHGFAAHTEERGRTLTIVAEHCPFGEAAKKYPHVVCAVDRGMIRGMLAGLYGETHPRHTQSRPAGDDHCVARV